MVLGQNLGQIRSSEKSKETCIINSFFHILHREYLLKQKAMVLQTFEWKCKADIARNTTSERLLSY